MANKQHTDLRGLPKLGLRPRSRHNFTIFLRTIQRDVTIENPKRSDYLYDLKSWVKLPKRAQKNSHGVLTPDALGGLSMEWKLEPPKIPFKTIRFQGRTELGAINQVERNTKLHIA